MCWLCGNGLVSTVGGWDKSLKASSSLGHRWVMWSSLQSLQGNFTFHFSFFPSPALLFNLWLLVLSSTLLLFLPPLQLFCYYFSDPYDYYLFLSYHSSWSMTIQNAHPMTVQNAHTHLISLLFEFPLYFHIYC
jgi:hypothetical protein